MRSCIFILILMKVFVSFGQDDCVFNQKSLTDQFLEESKEVIHYTWDSEQHEGQAILRNKGVLNIKKWACHHYGLSVNMLLPKDSDLINNWKGYLSDLSAIVNSKSSHQTLLEGIELVKSLDSLSVSKGNYEINLSNNIYPEYYISIHKLVDCNLISIYHYRN